jgi:hypothetical protein
LWDSFTSDYVVLDEGYLGGGGTTPRILSRTEMVGLEGRENSRSGASSVQNEVGFGDHIYIESTYIVT